MADSPFGRHVTITPTSSPGPLEPGQIPIWRGLDCPIGAWPRNKQSRRIHELLFDFSQWMSGQVLVYLRDNVSLHVGMECVSQFSERLWRRDHDEGLRPARTDHLFHGRSDLLCEPVLFDVMPVGRFDGAPAT